MGERAKTLLTRGANKSYPIRKSEARKLTKKRERTRRYSGSGAGKWKNQKEASSLNRKTACNSRESHPERQLSGGRSLMQSLDGGRTGNRQRKKSQRNYRKRKARQDVGTESGLVRRKRNREGSRGVLDEFVAESTHGRRANAKKERGGEAWSSLPKVVKMRKRL